MARTIYKYIDREWVESCLRGQIRVRSLSNYRQLEKTNPLGDPLDGTLLNSPDGGLEITNQTQGWKRIIPRWGFKSTLKQTEEILVFCASLRLDERLPLRFQKDACVAIRDRAEFSNRMRRAMGPLVRNPATFRALPVNYYDEKNPPGVAWAIPEMILMSKRRHPFETEAEFRLACGPTSAFQFEGANYELVIGDLVQQPSPTTNREHDLDLGDLRHICSVTHFR